MSNFAPTIINTEWHDSLAKIESFSDEINMVESDVSIRRKKDDDDVLANDNTNLKEKLLGSRRVYRRALSNQWVNKPNKS